MSLHRRTFKLLGNAVSMHQHRDGRLPGLLHSNDHEMAIWRHASASAIWTFVMFQLNNSKFSQACRVVRAKIEETLGISSNYGAKELGHIYVQLFTTKPSWLYKHISLSLSLAKHLTSRPCTDGHETTSQKNVTALDRKPNMATEHDYHTQTPYQLESIDIMQERHSYNDSKST